MKFGDGFAGSWAVVGAFVTGGTGACGGDARGAVAVEKDLELFNVSAGTT